MYIHTQTRINCVWLSVGALMQQRIWSWKWLDTKGHSLCCMSCILAGKFSKEFEIRYLARKPCTAPQLYASSPPLKNVIYTLGVKSISKIWLSRCMRSTKKSASHGAWEAQKRFLQRRSETPTCFFVIFTAEGCQKWQNVLPTLHGKHKKVMRFTEHEKQKTYFCNPSRLIVSFFWEHARFWPVSQRFWAKKVGFDPSQCAPGARMTVVTTNSLKLTMLHYWGLQQSLFV